MVYAVDFVLNVMEELSSTKPILFQRDGSLYVASEQGFGQVSYGLSTTPIPEEDLSSEQQSPEILESENLIQIVNKKPVYKDGEEPYLKAISYCSNGEVFSLEDIAQSVKELAKLDDDGNIRMISHGSRDHSHKHGYGEDGIDVWLQEARVMNKERCVELVREKEDEIFNRIEGIKSFNESRNFCHFYNGVNFPDCVILTPYMRVSLLRPGIVMSYDGDTSSWTERTKFSARNGSIMQYEDINVHYESPFEINVKINSQSLNASDMQEFDNQREKITDRISKEFDAVNLNMGIAEEYLDKLNSTHDDVCASYIEFGEYLSRNTLKK